MADDVGRKGGTSEIGFRVDTLGETVDEKAEVARTVVLVATVVVLTDTVARWALVAGVGLGVRPIGLGLVAAAVVVGKPARWGSAVGLLAVGLFLGDWTAGVVGAIAAYVATVLAVRTWAGGGEARDGPWSGWLLRYGVVAIVAVFAFVAVESWLFDVLGRAAFSVTAPRAVVTTIPLAILGAPLVRPVARRTERTSWEVPERPMSERSRVIAAVTVVCWVVFGYVGSTLFRFIGQAPPGSVGRRISRTLGAFVGLWGRQGTYAELLLGLLALVVLAAVLRWE